MVTPDRLVFVSNNHHSSTIRANQIADYLGATVYNGDMSSLPPDATCVFIKHMPPPDFPCRKGYVDVLDGRMLRYPLQETPHLGVIAFTRESQRHLNQFLGRRDVIYLPQHHCNFDREVRPPRDIRTVGFVGARSSLSYGVEEVGNRLADVGLDFRYLMLRRKEFVDRSEVVELYKHTDIQIFFRTRTRFTEHRFKDSLKVINAGSYRIPTVGSHAHTGMSTEPGMMLVIPDINGVVSACASLRDNPRQYEQIVDRVYPATEDYHISRIAPLYLQL